MGLPVRRPGRPDLRRVRQPDARPGRGQVQAGRADLLTQGDRALSRGHPGPGDLAAARPEAVHDLPGQRAVPEAGGAGGGGALRDLRGGQLPALVRRLRRGARPGARRRTALATQRATPDRELRRAERLADQRALDRGHSPHVRDELRQWAAAALRLDAALAVGQRARVLDEGWAHRRLPQERTAEQARLPADPHIRGGPGQPRRSAPTPLTIRRSEPSWTSTSWCTATPGWPAGGSPPPGSAIRWACSPRSASSTRRKTRPGCSSPATTRR